MVRRCYVAGCNSSSRNSSLAVPHVSFHHFPADRIIAAKWEEIIASLNNQPDIVRHTKYSCICSKHFEPKCIQNKNGQNWLVPGSIPTRFPIKSLDSSGEHENLIVDVYPDIIEDDPSTLGMHETINLIEESEDEMEQHKFIDLSEEEIRKFNQNMPNDSKETESELNFRSTMCSNDIKMNNKIELRQSPCETVDYASLEPTTQTARARIHALQNKVNKQQLALKRLQNRSIQQCKTIDSLKNVINKLQNRLVSLGEICDLTELMKPG